MEAFDNIESQTIERFNQLYQKSDYNPQYQKVQLGVYTVDLKEKIKYLTEEPDNSLFVEIIFRGESYKRPRSSKERFNEGFNFDIQYQRKIKFKKQDGITFNWIGLTWR